MLKSSSSSSSSSSASSSWSVSLPKLDVSTALVADLESSDPHDCVFTLKPSDEQGHFQALQRHLKVEEDESGSKVAMEKSVSNKMDELIADHVRSTRLQLLRSQISEAVSDVEQMIEKEGLKSDIESLERSYRMLNEKREELITLQELKSKTN